MRLTRRIMGMPVTVEVAGAGDGVRAVAELAFEYLKWVDRKFSTYKPESEVSRLNRGELRAQDADPAVREVLAACEELRERTDGYFDIRREGGIDPSGYVKGWAIRGAAQVLEAAGFRDFAVEAGGDMQVCGERRVGIRNPLDRRQVVKVLRIADGAVATSGTYERGEHIYNPLTRRPATYWASLTVVGPDIVEADVYATAGCAMGASGPEWVAAQGLECYAIGHDGKATFTPGLAFPQFSLRGGGLRDPYIQS